MTPPLWNEDAEQAVLSAMLNDSTALVRVLEAVDDSMFYAERHRRLFRAMVTVAERGAVVDPLTLADELSRRGELEGSGGKAYIGLLLDAVPTTEHVLHHAGIVRDFAQRRALIADLEASAAALKDAGVSSVQHVARSMSATLLGYTVDDAAASGFQLIKTTLWPTMEAIEARAGGHVGGILTGYERIDAETAGFREGELLILAGAEKQGKSAVALNMALRIARRSELEGGGAVAYVSAEMTRQTLEERCLAWASRIPASKLATGKLVDDDFPKLAHAAGEVATLPLWIDDEAEPSLADVTARCTALKAQHPELRVIVVDFLQLVHDRQKGVPESVELKKVAYGLKRLAKSLLVFVIAPCQVNSKDIEELKDPRPRLKDLQGSSGMRQAADFVALLYRAGAYNELAANAHEIELNFAACRRTQTFLARLRWHGPTLRVDDHRDWPALTTTTQGAA